MGKRGLVMTAADVAAHQTHHGFAPNGAPSAISEPIGAILSKPDRMTVPEREYDLILRGMLSRGEILDYRYQGVSLAWGRNPKTGKLMRYKCDFWVWRKATLNLKILPVTIIETKGPRIWPKDLIRFRGCRAEWPMFLFELHQRDEEGRWHHVE